MISLQGCSDWWVRSTGGLFSKREPGFLEWLQASVYFLPHVLFRLFALSLILGFIGYYSIALLAIMALLAILLALPVYWKLKWKEGDGVGISALLSLVLTLFAPISFTSNFSSHRRLMKRTITLITTSLLIVITLIRILPIIVDPDTLVATQGLCHLNFHQPSGVSF